ncbi:hypothetical protein ACEQ8H_008106 [Pleosporales sp. CAS-2024a]
MPPSHISGTSRALYRVFIAPTLRVPTSIPPLVWAPAFAPTSSCPPSLTPRTTVRTKVFTKDTERHALTDHFVINKAIPSNRINFVDANEIFYSDVSLEDALDSINHTTHYLVQMTPGTVDEFGNQDPNDLPTCRVWTKMALRQHHERKMDLARRQAKGLGAGPPPKTLELNWAIAPGDLKHRLGKLRDFMTDGKGRKVEVMFGPKKSGPKKTMKKATDEEAMAVVQAVRKTVAECKGRELKQYGQMGGILTVTFEARKEKKKEEQEEEEGKGEGEAEGEGEENIKDDENKDAEEKQDDEKKDAEEK